MNDIAHNLAQVRDKISAAATRCGRASEEITLLAVSKTKPASAIAEAIAAGHRAFGENYVQEGVDKIRAFRERGNTDLQWHFIGPLQSNKSRLVAEHFDWCHTIDRLRIATRLSDQRNAGLAVFITDVDLNQHVKRWHLHRALVAQTGSDAQTIDGVAPVKVLCYQT
ncbi:YggS family pyridoxal phosphate-dependent enzyme, partial [Enterobacter hormaechei]|uniref:YggS family pyridoxal phosphate-dependent enzyme n=1 Tax=Enterobacter hormaechei TaxID=158836 RepID=UPI000AE38A7B